MIKRRDYNCYFLAIILLLTISASNAASHESFFSLIASNNFKSLEMII